MHVDHALALEQANGALAEAKKKLLEVPLPPTAEPPPGATIVGTLAEHGDCAPTVIATFIKKTFRLKGEDKAKNAETIITADRIRVDTVKYMRTDTRCGGLTILLHTVSL